MEGFSEAEWRRYHLDEHYKCHLTVFLLVCVTRVIIKNIVKVTAKYTKCANFPRWTSGGWVAYQYYSHSQQLPALPGTRLAPPRTGTHGPITVLLSEKKTLNKV